MVALNIVNAAISGVVTGITKADVGLADVQDIKNNFGSIVDPVGSNDSSEGYSVGSVFVNTATNLSYTCVDSSVDAAVWQLTSYVDSNGVAGLDTVEVDQLKNINGTTISSTQWGYLGATDQSLGGTISFGGLIVDSLTFNGDTITSSGDININPTGQVLMGVEPDSDTSIATKGYVDSLVQGLDVKASVRAATTANLGAAPLGSGSGKTLTGTGTLAANNGDFDGVTLDVGDRVAVVLQSATTDNGIYTVTSDNPWVLTRATDADGSPTNEVSSGLFCRTTEGTVNTTRGFVLTTNADPFTVDTHDWVFSAIIATDANAVSVSGGGTDNAIARYADTTGISIKNSGIIINDTGDMTGVNDLTLTGTITSSIGQLVNTVGINNTFAGGGFVIGTQNTVYGVSSTVGGTDNTLIGDNLTVSSGDGNTLIGSNASCIPTANNQTSIGSGATCDSANQITLGNASVSEIRCLSNANLGSETNEFKDLYLSGELKLSSTTNAFTPPKLTTIQRDVLTPVSGNIIFNTDTNNLEKYNGAGWFSVVDDFSFFDLQLGDTTETIGSGFGSYRGGVLAPNGKIYFCPDVSTTILTIDTLTGATNTFGTIRSGSFKYFGGVYAPNGKIYFTPTDNVDILVVDTFNSDAISIITDPLITNVGDGFDFIGCTYAPNGKIYFTPAASPYFLILDTLNSDALSSVNVTNGVDSGNCIGSALAPNGIIYCGSTITNRIVTINTANMVTIYNTIPGYLSDSWRSATLAPNGKIYCCPFNSLNILVIDPPADGGTPVFTNIGTLPSGVKYRGACLAPNGKIYCAGTSISSILVIDTVTDTFTTIPTTSGRIGCTIGYDGCIYSSPASGLGSILKITPSNGRKITSLERCTSAYYNNSY